MTRWVFDGFGLPAGEPVHLEAGDGDPETLPGRFVLPGLVDSHCHLTVGISSRGPVPLDEGAARATLDDLGQAGVRAVRDVGGDRSVTLKLAASPEDGRPLVLAAVEHGTNIAAEDLEVLGARGGAWTPTLSAYGPPDPNGSPERLERRLALSEHMTAMLPLARQYGVHVLTGSDMIGTVAGEIDQLVQHGLTVPQALEAATTSASEFLGLTGTDDLVTYDADPRDHPEVLASPTSVVLRGNRIR